MIGGPLAVDSDPARCPMSLVRVKSALVVNEHRGYSAANLRSWRIEPLK